MTGVEYYHDLGSAMMGLKTAFNACEWSTSELPSTCELSASELMSALELPIACELFASELSACKLLGALKLPSVHGC